jgi:hypothetical protein
MLAVNDHADYVFRIAAGSIERLPARAFRVGLLGQTLEAALQRLLELHPEVVPGGQIDPGAVDPPRFALLRREMAIGTWSLDHVLVDQHGVLTLVEAKLVENPEARREVVGQIMDYAANARDAWSGGRLRERAAEFWQRRGRQVDDVLRERLGDEIDVEALWAAIEASLSTGHVRLLIASDELRPEVRRVIEYLNSELRNAEVYGLELKCYGTDEETFVLVPRLVGRIQATADRKARDGTPTTWTPDRLNEAFTSVTDTTLRTRLLALLEWAQYRASIIAGPAKMPTLGVRGRANNRLFSVSLEGYVYWVTKESAYLEGSEERDQVVARLCAIGLFDPALDLDAIVDGRRLSRRFTDFTDDQFSAFLELIDAVASSAPDAGNMVKA